MTTPRGSYGGGYGGYPSSASFPDTPIYDSLVAERGTPQIAPIRVPTPYSGFDSGMPAGYGGANLPATRPALPALPAGPSSPSYQPPQPPAPGGYPGGGYPQPPTPYVPQQAQPPRGGYGNNGFNGGGGFNGSSGFNGGFPPGGAPMGAPMAQPMNGQPGGHPGSYGGGMPQQAPPGGYEAARPVPPRPVPPRQVPGGHPEEQYPRRNLGNGGGGYYQG